MAGLTYESVWQNLFAVFHWPEDRQEAFFAKYKDDLADEESLFFHEDPAYWITWELLSQDVVDEIFARLAGRGGSTGLWDPFVGVQQIINKHTNWYRVLLAGDAETDVNWEAVRDEIIEFLRKKGKRTRCGWPP